jgi:glycosyltransferase involved in cell wall biosynthesis
LVSFIRENEIEILHAHAESVFIAALAALIPPHPVVIWHGHWGGFAAKERAARLYRLATTTVSGVIAVSQPLADWLGNKLHVPKDRVWYLPNFVCAPIEENKSATLPGMLGARIACVANLRPEKDQITLIRAIGLIIKQVPTIHLLLVGGTRDPAYYDGVLREISQQGLCDHVSLLGDRRDVNAILRECSIGILSSADEGFPLALLEYGLAGLPVIATKVGQCAEVLDQGRAGILVPPGSPDKLADALLTFLQSSEQAKCLGSRLRARVQTHYSQDRILDQVCQIYDTVLRSAKSIC